MSISRVVFIIYLLIIGIYADSERKQFAFNGHLYQRIDTQLKWSDAINYCQDRGGHLVTITSAEEDSFVYKCFGIDGTNLWIGATDESGERKWRWVTGEPFVYSNWASRMPDNAVRGQNYAIFWDLDPGHWDDNGLPNCDCKFIFICEWEDLL
jgi:hypothetical protein